MNPRIILMVVVAASLLMLILMLQTRRVSRVWLRWLPKGLRESIGGYFDPPPAVHPDVPDPNEIEVGSDASRQDERGAAMVRAVLSFAHGLTDAEHYVVRFTIAFVVAAIAALVLIAVLVAIRSL
jgi:hypothetical protein